MPKSSTEDLESFLRRQDAGALIEVLLELAHDHEPVRARLARMQLASRPDKLAAAFKKTLTSWKRSTRYYEYREASAFGRQLEDWLDQVAHELQPMDPGAAVALFEAFIEADAAWFDRADDSDGAIGNAVRSACQHWLQAAAACETPADVWAERLFKLYDGDEYGAREHLLRHAHLLLDEAALRRLVAVGESRLVEALAKSAGVSTASRVPYEVISAASALSLLSESLRDPDIRVRATLQYSPNPNPLQRQDFVRAYMDADRPADALAWLQESWGHLEGSRQSLLSEVLERLGRFEESLPIRQRAFEESLSVFDLERWLEHMPLLSQPQARDHARQMALDHESPAPAATLLLHLGETEAAESRLLTGASLLDGRSYESLVPLAKALRSHDCPRGEAAIYRALLMCILDRANSTAYGHAARYWARLDEIAAAGTSLEPLPPHEAFVGEIRTRHARKTAFWARVSGTRRVEPDAGGAAEADEDLLA